jgi:hypothetical protein
MRMMIDREVVVTGMFFFWGFRRSEVETYSIWQDRLEVGHGFPRLGFNGTLS